MLVSLITACYNSAGTLADTIESVRMQKDCVLEYLVIDGGSADNTVDLIRAAGSLVSHWTSEPDAGIYDALNKGISRSTGDVIGFLHADDTFADQRVLSRVAEIFADRKVQACYGDLVYVGQTDPSHILRYWRSGPFEKAKLARGWMPPHPTFYVRREVYERFGGFDTQYRIAADYDCMLRILSRMDGEVAYIPEVLVRMRAGGISNRSLRNIIRKSKEDYRALRTNSIGGWPALAWKNLSKLGQFVQRQTPPDKGIR